MQFRSKYRCVIASKYSIPSIMLASTLLSQSVFAEAILNPNQINGSIQFTNKNPAIIERLTASGLGEGISRAYIRADSIDHTPTLNNTTFIAGNNGTGIDFQMTLESSADGISYKIHPQLYMDKGNERFNFVPLDSTPVYPEPTADVVFEAKQCAAMLDISFVDSQGNPMQVNGGHITGYRERSAGSNQFEFQAQDFNIPNGTSNTKMMVSGEGNQYRVNILYEFGLDPFHDKIRNQCNHTITTSCDEIVPIECVIEQGVIELGAISGDVGVTGESLLTDSSLTRIYATNGPFLNARYDHVEGAGSYLLENLVPSDAVSPERGYLVYGEMALRSGYRTEYLRTPFKYGANGDVKVYAGQVTDITDALVLNPGFVSGNIGLIGPKSGEFGTGLEDLYRDMDVDRDNNNLPDSLRIWGSHVRANGSYMKSEGATLSAQGGHARVSFEGAYDATSGAFNGDYELVLGGLKGEASLWNVADLSLQFLDRNNGTIPQEYQDSRVTVRDLNIPLADIKPGGHETFDRDYCFNDVQLVYRTTSGTFYRPQARAQGAFLGNDFRDVAVNYQATLEHAWGTPLNTASASNIGLVVMTLPQGNYDITPKVTAINPNGSTTESELPPVSLEVGCGQVIQASTDIQITAGDLPQDSDADTITVSADLNSDVPVIQVDYVNNENPPVIVCQDDCQQTGTVSADVPLEEGDNVITLTATNEAGNQASVSATVTYTPPAPDYPLIGLQCNDKTIRISESESGAEVEFAISTSGGCGELTVNCDAQSGDFFGLGLTNVNCQVSDECGDQAQCEFAIEVENGCIADDSKPVLEQSIENNLLWPPNHNLTNIGLSKELNTCDYALKTSLQTQVWSDEEELNKPSKGDGRFAPDAKENEMGLRLRQERQGSGDGRVYLIITRGEDSMRQPVYQCSTVVVPHANNKHAKNDVLIQAQIAREYCEVTGEAPAEFFEHGISEEVGSKQ